MGKTPEVECPYCRQLERCDDSGEILYHLNLQTRTACKGVGIVIKTGEGNDVA